MKTNTLICIATFMAIISLPVALSAGVFDDAIFWCRGALDKNGNGYPDEGDFPDALHAGDSTYYGHKGSSWYKSNEPARQFKISTEEIVEPATCRSLGLHQCLKFTQPLYDNGGATWIDEQAFRLTEKFNSQKPSDADGWAFYIRFRSDGGVKLTDAGDTQYLFNYFHKLADNSGGAILMIEGPATMGYLSVQLGGGAGSKKSLTGMQTSDYCLCTNKWTDVIVSRVGDKVDVYSIREGGRLYHQAYTYSRTEDTGFYSQCVLGRYLYDASAHAYNSSNTYNFRGSVHDFAIWPRALSAAEVMEIIRPTGTEKFRLGTHNGSSLEFAGTGSPTVEPYSTNGWRSSLATIGAGQSLSVKFDMKTNETALDEMLFFTAMPESGAGALSLALNGSNVGAIQVQPGKTVSCPVGKGSFVGGENVLVLSNNSGATIKVDGISFGGSWQLLEEDDSILGGAAQNGGKDFYLNDTNLVANLKTILHVGSKISNTNLTFHFTMPADLVETLRRVRFVVRAKSGKNWQWTGSMPDLVFRVLVNGESRGDLVFPKTETAYHTSKLTIPAEALVAGENTIRVENATPLWYDPAQPGDLPACMLSVDFYRLEVMQDPLGLMLIVK